MACHFCSRRTVSLINYALDRKISILRRQIYTVSINVRTDGLNTYNNSHDNSRIKSIDMPNILFYYLPC